MLLTEEAADLRVKNSGNSTRLGDTLDHISNNFMPSS